MRRGVLVFFSFLNFMIKILMLEDKLFYVKKKKKRVTNASGLSGLLGKSFSSSNLIGCL